MARNAKAPVAVFEIATPRTVQARVKAAPACGSCGLLTQCRTPKLPMLQVGTPAAGGLVVVMSGVTPFDDFEGKHASAGVCLVRNCLESVGCRSYVITSATACCGEVTDDRTEYCRPLLFDRLQELNPSVVVVLGTSATRSVLGPVYRANPGGAELWAGCTIPEQTRRQWLCVSYDAHAIMELRATDARRQVSEVLLTRHLTTAASLIGRPVPVHAYPEPIVCLNADEAVPIIDDITQACRPAAFDYECLSLKPEAPGTRLLTCAVSDGTRTVGFPMAPSTADAMRRFLTSPCPKFGANAKFEERWSRRHLGVRVNNWVWDVTLDAHVLDNRKGVTSVEHQTFRRLGIAPWDAEVEPYIHSEHAMDLNTLHKCPLRQLLTYNAYDALYEYHVCREQAAEAAFLSGGRR